jgi:hypothetical protein
MKTTFWCLGEEQVSFEIINLIKLVLKEVCNCDLLLDKDNISFNEFFLDGKVSFEIKGLKSDRCNRFIYTIVEKDGNGFVDYLCYESDNFPLPNSKPLAVAEATKNKGSESGNMSDQRSGKIIPIKEKWGNIPYFYIISNPNKIEEIEKSFKQSHKCAFATIIALGGTIIISSTDKFGYKKYINEFEYNSIEDIENQEFKKKGSSGVPSRVYLNNGEAYISANLYKKGGEHDPGVGYVSSRSYLVRSINPDIKINIINHKRDINFFKRENNKLINVLKTIGVNILLKDSNFEIEKKSNIYKDKSYWKYANSGEKIATILMEKIFEKKGWEVLFTNHAGCGKSYIKINNKFYTSKNKKGIPDLVLYNKDLNKIMVIEGETTKNYKNGIRQINDENFNEFIKSEFLIHLPNVIVEKYISTYGDFNNEEGVIFNITKEFEVNINENVNAL